MRIQFTALALAVVLPFTAAQAADKPESKRTQQWFNELNLSAGQMQEFEQKRERFHGEQQEHFQQFREEHGKLRDDFQAKQQARRDSHHDELRALLTKEQLETFDQHLAKMEKKREKMAKRASRYEGKNNKMQHSERRQKGLQHPREHEHRHKSMNSAMHQQSAEN